MKQKLNSKGFTLVEIVVVLMIVSIVMALAGSMILSSFNLFGESTQADVNKRALDKIASYVKSELEYASDIRISEVKPEGDNWSYLDILNGRLIQNDDASNLDKEYSVYSDSFYYDNLLEIDLSSFKESNQFDIDYRFSKNSNKTYEAAHTLRFSNLTLKSEKDETYKPFNGLLDNYLLSSNVKLYYISNSENTVIEEEKPTTNKGTVADQISFLNNYNNRGNWEKDIFYRMGDMVFYNGYWWYHLVDHAGSFFPPNNSNLQWKKIDAYFNVESAYQKGDIVIFEDNYYECTEDAIQMGSNPLPNNPNWSKWKKLEDNEHITLEEILDSKIYNNQYPLNVETVRNELDSAIDITLFKQGQTYKKGDIVKIYLSGFEGDDKSANYYKCIADTSNINPETKGKYEWKYLDIGFNENSAYEKSDVIFYNQNNYYAYYKANENINKITDPKREGNNEGVWRFR